MCFSSAHWEEVRSPVYLTIPGETRRAGASSVVVVS